jgi:hypothetical protein
MSAGVGWSADAPATGTVLGTLHHANQKEISMGKLALEELGQPYEVRLVSFRALKEPAHLALNPFGSIPTYEEGELALFESGASVFHAAERHPGLLPDAASLQAGFCRATGDQHRQATGRLI